MRIIKTQPADREEIERLRTALLEAKLILSVDDVRDGCYECTASTYAEKAVQIIQEALNGTIKKG